MVDANVKGRCVELAGSSLYYQRYGSGPVVWLLFHGFGQDHRRFEKFAELLGDGTSCYAFDLFHHGRSAWTPGHKPITPEVWDQFIRKFLEQENVTRFGVVGYSIGARFAIATTELHANMVDRVVLIAPDGISENAWYRVATKSAPGRALFRLTVTQPGIFVMLAMLARSVGVISGGLMAFARKQMQSPEQRARVYKSWVSFRKLSAGPGLFNTMARFVFLWSPSSAGATRDHQRPCWHTREEVRHRHGCSA
ncbi:MAG: alpha/beta hydrolase [Bacteroidia bacterium]|nr:alpha/beta hydrolase [Bacteroidia bacterium]